MFKVAIVTLGLILGIANMGEAHISKVQEEQLIQSAVEVRTKSYSPYSKYKVGAALLTTEGKIFSGCNVENASFGLTNCAERSATFAAVSSGEKNFVAVAVITEDGQGTPCGACRQVLNEFNPDMVVILANPKGEKTKQTTLSELLPSAFGPKNLETN